MFLNDSLFDMSFFLVTVVNYSTRCMCLRKLAFDHSSVLQDGQKATSPMHLLLAYCDQGRNDKVLVLLPDVPGNPSVFNLTIKEAMRCTKTSHTIYENIRFERIYYLIFG